jgi:Fic family protein
MKPADIRSKAAGRCIKTTGGYWAFVPGPLPKTIDLNELWPELDAANASLGAIEGLAAAAQLPFLHLFLASAVRREATSSSQIEGIHTQMPDLLRAEVEDPNLDRASDDLRETYNCVRAMYQGHARLQEGLPLVGRLVRELHAILMDHARCTDPAPGEFRRVQNFIGQGGDTPQTARYVPPPPEEVQRLWKELEQFINRAPAMPTLVQCAIMHQRFEAIHPFGDGNGRIGRLLIPLFLHTRGRLEQPLLYLSEFLESHRRDYYDLLHAVNTHNEWTPWTRFFLRGVTVTSQKVLRQAKQMTALRIELRQRLRKKFRARNLLDELFANPYVNTTRAAGALNVDPKTARRSIALMEEQGILREITSRKWGKIWVADAILQIIDMPEERSQTP